MGTEEGSSVVLAESFCPTDAEVEKWMDSAFSTVRETRNGSDKFVAFSYFIYIR